MLKKRRGGGWIEDNCHADRMVGIVDAVLDSAGALMSLREWVLAAAHGRRWSLSVRRLRRVGTGWRAQVILGGAGWAVEEEVEVGRIPDTKLVMRKAHQVAKHHCSPAKDVCPARLAADDCILESPAAEEQQIESA